MIEKLLQLDTHLFLLINHSGTSLFDPVMRFLSSAWIWIPVFGYILYHQIREQKHRAWVNLLILILVYVASEQISNHLLKDTIQRLRPCHQSDLAGQVRLVARQCGGLYSFVSTHASNAFSVALFSLLLIKKNWYTISILIWAVLVSYSRIYLGVHFPGDVTGGIILGIILAYTGFTVSKLICTSHKPDNMTTLSL